MKKQHRVFIAINLPQEIKQELSLFQKKWNDLPVKWTNKDNFHITLAFLGNLTDVELGEVCVAVKEESEKHSPFDIKLNNISYVPVEKIPPRMIWAMGEKSKELSVLKRGIDDSLSNVVRFKPRLHTVRGQAEVRTFSPHITLAKVKTFEWRHINPEERPEINKNIDLSFSVESIEVMSSRARSRFEGESVLKKTGPEYSIIESHNLG